MQVFIYKLSLTSAGNRALLLTPVFIMMLFFSDLVFSSTQKLDTKSQPFALQWAFVHLPPIAFLDKEGRAQGELAELMNKVSELSGVPYEAFEFPNIRAISNLNRHQLNFSIGVKTLVNEMDNFILSRMPVAKMQLQILWNNSATYLNTIDDLSGKRVVLLNGYTYNGMREKVESLAQSIIDVETHNRALVALKLGRGDYALVYKTASEYSMSALSESDFKSLVIAEVDLYFILDASVPNAQEIMKRLETAFLDYQTKDLDSLKK